MEERSEGQFVGNDCTNMTDYEDVSVYWNALISGRGMTGERIRLENSGRK